jgi:hypothetical protein
VLEDRKNSNIPIWQIVSDQNNPPLQLNANIPVGVRYGYRPQVAQASFDEIYEFIIYYNNKGKEVTVLEHHIEQNSHNLPSDTRYYHNAVKVNKNTTDPLIFTLDLDIIGKGYNNLFIQNKLSSVIEKIISFLKSKNINSSKKDFIVLTSPFDKLKNKHSFHILLRKKGVLCKNQYTFLNMLKIIKGDDKHIDKMFPGMITRLYKTGKYPMNQPRGRLFKCHEGAEETLTKKDFTDDRDFFKNTLMYFHNYMENREDYILL